MAFSSEVLTFSALWFSADSRKPKSDKFDQWRRQCEGTCMHTSTEDRSHTKLRCEDFARSILPWRRAPDQRQRSVRRYLYISWQKAKSTRNCGARLRLAPITSINYLVCVRLFMTFFYFFLSSFLVCLIRYVHRFCTVFWVTVLSRKLPIFREILTVYKGSERYVLRAAELNHSIQFGGENPTPPLRTPHVLLSQQVFPLLWKATLPSYECTPGWRGFSLKSKDPNQIYFRTRLLVWLR